MRRYKVIFIVCFGITLWLMIKAAAPSVKNMANTYMEEREGSRSTSSSDLRAGSVGETYIPESVIEHNENVEHADVVIDENHAGDMGEGEVYATPIYGGEEIARRFANTSNYYKGEIKLEEAIYKYIPQLMEATKSMTNSQIKAYYDANADLIEKQFGIISGDNLVKLVGSMDKLEGKKFTKVNIPANAITENYKDLSLNFLIEMVLEDGSKVAPISVNLSHMKSSPNQAAPYIRITGLYKSQRAE